MINSQQKFILVFVFISVSFLAFPQTKQQPNILFIAIGDFKDNGYTTAAFGKVSGKKVYNNNVIKGAAKGISNIELCNDKQGLLKL